MNAHWMRGFSIAIMATAASVFGPSCVDNPTSIFVQGCVVPNTETCESEASSSSTMRMTGTLDVYYRLSYSCPLLFGNQLIPVANDERARAETSRINVYSYDVTLNKLDGEFIKEYSVPATGFANPGATQPGFGLVDALLLDSETGAELTKNLKVGEYDDVVATVKLRGRTTGGVEVESDTWDYPIVICKGCLCQNPAGACSGEDVDEPDPNCILGQDINVDCRLVQADCPANGE